MSTTPTTPGSMEATHTMSDYPTQPATPWAVVNYVARDGQHMTFDSLDDALDALACELEDKADLSKGKSAATLREAAVEVRGLIPDPDALEPEPDP